MLLIRIALSVITLLVCTVVYCGLHVGHLIYCNSLVR